MKMMELLNMLEDANTAKHKRRATKGLKMIRVFFLWLEILSWPL